jgi:putative ABC transport system permease protein
MTFWSAIRVALGALLVNKGRSALTSLGIVIGISAVIAMVSAGGGARQKLEDQLEIVGKNLILIRPGARSESGIVGDIVPLTMEDAEAIKKSAGPLLLGVAPEQITQRLVMSKTANWPTLVDGVVPELQGVRNWSVARGRFISEVDTKKVSLVCVIGKSVERKLFPNSDPIGELVRVPPLAFRVVGVLGEKGRSPTGGDQDDQIFVPLTAFQRELVGNSNLSVILATARSHDLLGQAKERIIDSLRRTHHLRPGDPNDFDVSSVQEMAELYQVLTATLQILVGVIASISLIVGGIGIMNIMLVSVTERTREIGIRMSVGATGADILFQFLCEAVVLAFLGGLLGISVGLLGALGLAQLAHWPLVISPAMVLVAFGVSAFIGVFFGFYPAWKASRLDPIEALRFE